MTASTLNANARAVLVATSALVGDMTSNLEASKKAALHRVLAGGGRIGIEATTDGKHSCRLCLVAFLPDGERLQLASITTLTGSDIGHSGLSQ